jgi:AhpD family alkylhydroperoxidase
LIFLTASVENHCRYCVAAHATALKALRFTPKDVRAVREREPLDDVKLGALMTVTRELVSERGFVAPKTRQKFLKAASQRWPWPKYSLSWP